jgi:RNA polymerase sigma factor (sigma-70 family)
METRCAVSIDEQLQAWLAIGAYRPALTLLAETYLESIFRYCLRMCEGQTALAEEVTQQVFEAACRGIVQFRAESSAKTWLFAIAHHRVLHARERQRREGTLQQREPQMHQAYEQALPFPDADGGWPLQDDVTRLRAALAHTALAPVDRSMVLLRFGIDVPQALSVAEIAAVLGLSRDMVYRRLKVALALLRRIMDDNLECQGRRSRGEPRAGGTLALRMPRARCHRFHPKGTLNATPKLPLLP